MYVYVCEIERDREREMVYKVILCLQQDMYRQVQVYFLCYGIKGITASLNTWQILHQLYNHVPVSVSRISTSHPQCCIQFAIQLFPHITKFKLVDCYTISFFNPSPITYLSELDANMPMYAIPDFLTDSHCHVSHLVTKISHTSIN